VVVSLVSEEDPDLLTSVGTFEVGKSNVWPAFHEGSLVTAKTEDGVEPNRPEPPELNWSFDAVEPNNPVPPPELV
jgi:hypothetical protein